MAKKSAAKKNNKSFEESLWETATKLRGSVESSEYKHVVLSLIFLKFVSDKFEERRAELIAEGKEKYVDMVEFYAMNNVFYLPETSRWSSIQQHANQSDTHPSTAMRSARKSSSRPRALRSIKLSDWCCFFQPLELAAAGAGQKASVSTRARAENGSVPLHG